MNSATLRVFQFKYHTVSQNLENSDGDPFSTSKRILISIAPAFLWFAGKSFSYLSIELASQPAWNFSKRDTV